MKTDLKAVARLVLLLVIFGFFMPVACEMSGPQLTNFAGENGDGLVVFLLLLVPLSVFVPILFGIMSLAGRSKKISFLTDWLPIGVSAVSATMVYVNYELVPEDLEVGAYLMIIGWISGLSLLAFAIRRPTEP